MFGSGKSVGIIKLKDEVDMIPVEHPNNYPEEKTNLRHI